MTVLVNRLDKRGAIFRPPDADDLDDWGQQTDDWIEVA